MGTEWLGLGQAARRAPRSMLRPVCIDDQSTMRQEAMHERPNVHRLRAAATLYNLTMLTNFF
jgi:hypothetical protein